MVPLLLVALMVLQALLRPSLPGRLDPVQRLAGGDGPVPVVLWGRLLNDPRPPACTALLAGKGGTTDLVFPNCPPLQEGWMVQVSGDLRRPSQAPHPLLAGRGERLRRQGVWTRLRVRQWEVLQRPATPLADLRRRIASRFITLAGPQRGSVLAALVLGSAAAPPSDEVREAFRTAGLSHALAASGFHLSVLLGFVLAVARPFGRAARLLLGGGAMGLFLLLAGPHPSVVRAVLMGGLALLALENGRRGRPLGLLGLAAAVMLLLRPHWLHDVGFQLSCAATAGLVVTAGPLQQRLQDFLPACRLTSWCAAALAVPLAATLWTLPLQLLHFGVVPLYAVPANVLASPLLAPLTLGSMAAALLGQLVPPLLPLLGAPLGLLAGVLLSMARIIGSLPLARWQSGRPEPLLVLLLAVALLGIGLPALRARWRAGAAGLLALVVILHLGGWATDRLLLVHQGRRDLLIARHRGRAALVSTGADPFSCRQARRLADGVGVDRYDWVLLLDPVAATDPTCWQAQTDHLVGEAEGSGPLLAGQRLASPGLAVEAHTMDSHALTLTLGERYWLLLPDPQALWAWRGSGRSLPPHVWLGFLPRRRDRQTLIAAGARQVWLSGPTASGWPLPHGWRASGASGFLLAEGA